MIKRVITRSDRCHSAVRGIWHPRASNRPGGSGRYWVPFCRPATAGGLPQAGLPGPARRHGRCPGAELAGPTRTAGSPAARRGHRPGSSATDGNRRRYHRFSAAQQHRPPAGKRAEPPGHGPATDPVADTGPRGARGVASPSFSRSPALTTMRAPKWHGPDPHATPRPRWDLGSLRRFR